MNIHVHSTLPVPSTRLGDGGLKVVDCNIDYVTVQCLGVDANGNQCIRTRRVHDNDALDSSRFCKAHSQQLEETEHQRWSKERKRLVNLRNLLDFFSYTLSPDEGMRTRDAPQPDVISELQDFFSAKKK